MPLKLVKPRPPSPNWSIRGTYLHKYVNRSAGTSKRAVALQVLRQIERQIEHGEFAEPGEPTFASAALNYMKAGGEKRFLGPLLEHFGDTPLSKIDQQAIDAAAFALYPDGSPATRNRQCHTPVSGILRAAGRPGMVRRPSGSGGNKATTWLRPEQAFALFEEAEKIHSRFAALLIVLCYTGMRLGEALSLTWDKVCLEEEHAYLPVTKNGQPRGVFLPPAAVDAMERLLSPRREGRCFPFTRGSRLYVLLEAVAKRANVELPDRIAFHVFRHTWARWMMQYGGLNTKQLVGTGAWTDTKSAERYAHTVVAEEARKAVMLPTTRRVG